MRSERGIAPRPFPITARGVVLILIAIAAAASVAHLQVTGAGVAPSRGGLVVAARFLSRAASPALHYESDVPPGTVPLMWKAATAAQTTVMFAAAATSLALTGGIVLAFLGSSAWWASDPVGPSSRAYWWQRRLGPCVYAVARVLTAFLRSIHELLWAVLLLAAFGLGHLTAVFAIALPFAGVLGKVFSEMIDEAPRDAAHALRDAGASPLQVFFFGLVPRAFPDMAAYAFYRFECALRSSAVLGFFGFPTLGYYIAASFENLFYGEVWTYLYALLALVIVSDWWSGAIRRDFVV